MIAIVDYDAGNLTNVQKAFSALGYDAEITRDKKSLQNASHIVLPGVGAFSAGMQSLAKYDLIFELKRQAELGKPLLGICLGMQMLLTKSFENGESQGLDLISGEVKKLDVDLKIPHVGWNELKCENNPIVKNGSEVYFVHSYCAVVKNPENILCTTEYGKEFTSGVVKGCVYGLQFHPERSGKEGLEILKRFIEEA